MLLVVDTNIVFSALLTRGNPLLFFELNSLLGSFECIAPEFLFFEIGNRVDKILKCSQYSKENFIEVFSFIKKEIELIPLATFKERMQEALQKAPHEKDAPYVALALAFDCKIISGDKGLQSRLPEKVIAPAEAVQLLLKKTL